MQHQNIYSETVAIGFYANDSLKNGTYIKPMNAGSNPLFENMIHFFLIVHLALTANARALDNCGIDIKFWYQNPVPESSLNPHIGLFISTTELSTYCDRTKQCAIYCISNCGVCGIVTYNMISVRLWNLINVKRSLYHIFFCFRTFVRAVKPWVCLRMRKALISWQQMWPRMVGETSLYLRGCLCYLTGKLHWWFFNYLFAIMPLCQNTMLWNLEL